MAIRVGIIGSGGIGTKHLNTLKTIGRTEIVGICDIDKQKAKIAQENFGDQQCWFHVAVQPYCR